MENTFHFSAQIWKYGGKATWFFVTLPADIAAQIRFMASHVGFRTVRVHATIDNTTWETSLFPDKASDSYFLPLKAPIRKQCGLEEHDQIDVVISLVEKA